MTLGNRTITFTSSIDPVAQLREAEAILAQFGYDSVATLKRDGEFVAQATKVVGATTYTAQAIGRSQTAAVQSLVRTITRK